MDRIQPREAAINIIQWNAQSLKPKLVSFEAILNQEKVHIGIISETWLNSNININLSGYNVYRQDRLDSYGGVAVIVHKSLASHIFPINLTNAGIEVLCVKILNCKCLENVISVYCPSSVATRSSDWEQLFELNDRKTVIAGDFNGHHTNWSYKIDQRGTQLLDTSLENGFVSINHNEATRVKLVNGTLQKTSPDITFSSSDIATKFLWRVLNENLGSDHLILKISMNYEEQVKIIHKRNFKKANWTDYTSCLVEQFLNPDNFRIISSSNIQEAYDYLEAQINISANKNIPIVKICTNPDSKFKPKEYWNSKLSKVVAERRLALTIFRRNPTPANLDKFEEKVEDAYIKISQAKSRNWNSFCSSINETTSVSTMWKKMRWFKGQRHPKFTASLNKQKELLHSLTPDSVINQKPSINHSNILLDQPFSLQELSHCLKKKDTAPGSDGITYTMIYYLPQICKTYLLEIYNLIFVTGYVPRQWRKISVIPIPKAGYNNCNVEPKLRPISLISCMCKIFHNMIAKRLEWYTEKNQIFSTYTSGFRRGQSCVDCLARLVSYIQLGFSQNALTVACFLDIDNAYNNVLVDNIIKTLDDLKVGINMCQYLWSFLSERYLVMNAADEQMKLVRWANKGLAQGDPLAPLLFNLTTHKICKDIEGIVISQYADDFVFYIKNKDIKYCERTLQTALDLMVDKLDCMGLNLSTSKTKICVFSKGRRRNTINLKINDGLSINIVENIKYLGMWLDRSLLWNKHINEIAEKSFKFLNILKVLAGSGWGVHPKHLRSLYISLIRSRLDFGCFLYDHSANVHVIKLDRMQNKALRIIGGFIKSTPIHVMESELCLPPLRVRRAYLAYKFCIKSMSLANNVTIQLFQQLNDLINVRYWHNKKKPLFTTIFDKCKTLNINSNYVHGMFSLNIWVSYISIDGVIECYLDSVKGPKRDHEITALKCDIIKEINDKYYGWNKYFTDGSMSKGSRGAAYFDVNRNDSKMFKIYDNVSIMTLELIAILEALNAAHIFNDSFVVIFTDSKSALQHLAQCASGRSRGVTVAYVILNVIHSIIDNGVNLKLQWVPSHIGLKGNEEADRLAKLARSNGEQFNIKPDYTEQLFFGKTLCFDYYKEYFDERSKEKGIWYKTIQCQPPRTPWFIDSKIKRSYVIMAHRLRSGHYPSNKFGYLMKKVNSPNCEICGIIEDVHHLLMECNRYFIERETLMQKYNMSRYDVGTFLNVLANPTSDAAIALFEVFLHK